MSEHREQTFDESGYVCPRDPTGRDHGPHAPDARYCFRCGAQLVGPNDEPASPLDKLDPETKGEWIEMAVEMQEAARLGPPYVECSCGYPKKECLRLVLRNGPPYPPRPCEPRQALR